ncbi:hypothetical protein GVAV_002114 [Gurleya vavrai]
MKFIYSACSNPEANTSFENQFNDSIETFLYSYTSVRSDYIEAKTQIFHAMNELQFDNINKEWLVLEILPIDVDVNLNQESNNYDKKDFLKLLKDFIEECNNYKINCDDKLCTQKTICNNGFIINLSIKLNEKKEIENVIEESILDFSKRSEKLTNGVPTLLIFQDKDDSISIPVFHKELKDSYVFFINSDIPYKNLSLLYDYILKLKDCSHKGILKPTINLLLFSNCLKSDDMFENLKEKAYTDICDKHPENKPISERTFSIYVVMKYNFYQNINFKQNGHFLKYTQFVKSPKNISDDKNEYEEKDQLNKFDPKNDKASKH